MPTARPARQHQDRVRRQEPMQARRHARHACSAIHSFDVRSMYVDIDEDRPTIDDTTMLYAA